MNREYLYSSHSQCKAFVNTRKKIYKWLQRKKAMAFLRLNIFKFAKFKPK